MIESDSVQRWTARRLSGEQGDRRLRRAAAKLRSPALCGTEPHIVELFGARAADIHTKRRHFNFRYRSTSHCLRVFRDYYGLRG